MEPEQNVLRQAWASMEGAGAHLTDEAILAYLEGTREVAAEAHLASCPVCTRSLLELRRLVGKTAAPRPAGIRPWAAAAALLLAVAAWQLLRIPKTAPPSAPGPQVAPETREPSGLPQPGSVWKAVEADAESVLGESVCASLRQGSRLRLGLSPLEMTLEGGALLLESSGEAVMLRLGEIQATMTDGALAAEMPPASVAWLLRDARASEAPRLTVLRGQALLGTGQMLAAGQSLGQAASWQGSASWTRLLANGEVAKVRDAARLFLQDPPEAGYVFEALVRKLERRAEAGLVFRAGGSGWEAPLGENLLPAQAGWSRVRIEAGQGWCMATVGMRKVVSRPVPELGRELASSGERGVGLKAWGGDLEVREARWRPLQMGGAR